MTKIKTYVSRKHAGLSMIAKSSVLVEKGICVITFPTPYPQILLFFTVYMILLAILQMSEICQ